MSKLMFRRWIAASVVLGAGTTAAVIACSDADRNTQPPGGANGCIANACYDVAPDPGSGGDGGPGPGTDGSLPSNPLQGTSKAATLVVGSFTAADGPVWIGGRLIFSDPPANKILELSASNTATTFRSNSGGAIGNGVDQSGRLVTCEGANHDVVRSLATSGAATTAIASIFGPDGGAPFNLPNDVVVRTDGNVYFTDPTNGGAATQDAEAAYRISPGGTVSRISTTFQKPNGVALSPDQNTLYIVDNGAGNVRQAPLQSNGSVGTFTTVIGSAAGGDGMAVDDNGNLYVAAAAGILVFDKTGGAIGTVTVPEQPSNCTFGGADRRTLYVTAGHGLYSIVLNVPGLP